MKKKKILLTPVEAYKLLPPEVQNIIAIALIEEHPHQEVLVKMFKELLLANKETLLWN